LKLQFPYKLFLFLAFACSLPVFAGAQKAATQVRLIPVADGWANNAVNAAVFRRNSLVSYKDTQYISFYDATGFIVLGKRNIASDKWELKRTQYQGNTKDAHNIISMMVDGDGFLHIAWDHHNNPLHYAQSLFPGSLELTENISMTSQHEDRVTYPEFYKLPVGNLLFLYRDGGSGQGNLVMNRYDRRTKTWTQLHSNLIDGEGQRNAYWQACVDNSGVIHLSWVWRESPDVASNHDLCYARSKDGGVTWEKTTGEKYRLPINAATAEYALRIPQASELINQTSMTTDATGNPFIVTYWRDQGTNIPQYHVVYHTRKKWQSRVLSFRKTPFSLSGIGSKRIPIARPQVMVSGKGKNAALLMVFRDEERGSKVSVVTVKKIKKNNWHLDDLTQTPVGSWEPTYDTERWQNEHVLHLFVQRVEQVDAEGQAHIPPQPVQVLEWKPRFGK